jgi:hypothetical protein
LSAPPTAAVPSSRGPDGAGRCRRRPVLRVAAFGIATVIATFAAIGIISGVRDSRYDAARDRAAATTSGLVIQDNIGDDEDIRVRWIDRAGRSHTQLFDIYDVDQYTRGRRFPVAFDPADPHPRGYPADPDETFDDDTLAAPLEFATPIVFLVLLGWAFRGRWYLRNVGGPRPVGRLPATALTGKRRCLGPLSRGTSAWITLSTSGEPGQPADRLQRVMWHPSLDDLPAEFPVVVHGDPVRRRRVVIELVDGTRLVPIGRLRRTPPHLITLRAWAAAPTGPDAADTSVPAAVPAALREGGAPSAVAPADASPTIVPVVPADAAAVTAPPSALPAEAGPVVIPALTAPPAGGRWWRVAPSALIGAVLGSGAGFLLIGGVEGTLSIAACGAALMVNRWALAGTGPDRRDRRPRTINDLPFGQQPVPADAA